MDIPEGYANIRYRFAADGVQDEMSFAIGVFPSAAGSATDIADSADDAIRTSGLVANTTILQGWQYLGAQAVLTVGGEPNVGEHNFTVNGELTGESVMVNGAILVRKVTAFGGRKNRGRMFVPPYLLNESAVANSGVIETATATPLGVLFTALYDALVENELQPNLFHGKTRLPGDLPGAPPTGEPGPPTPITAFVMQNLMATQRRRMR